MNKHKKEGDQAGGGKTKILAPRRMDDLRTP